MNDEKSPIDSQSVRHTFSSQERYVLINLAEQILELLGQSSVSRDPLHDIVGISGNELPPDDPVLKRLLPSAYRELQDAAEFRRYTEDALRSKKREHARRIREMLLTEDAGDAVDQGAVDPGAVDPGALDQDGERESRIGNDDEDEHVFVHGDNEVELSAIKLKITGEDIWAWLGGLNDIRLALAVRLDIGGPTMGDLPNDNHRATDDPSAGDESGVNRRFELMKESDPMKAVFAVYSWLGWLQEEFLRQLDSSEAGDSDPSLPNP